ncbi:MAG: HlyC/CorC family transporter [Chloroflexi bacterium]|nr:HlyC/CorC family transporter [Chloroflexota bacterium]MBT5628336.1 HlyC/CorC family transporter [Chloroflexota bacterium]
MTTSIVIIVIGLLGSAFISATEAAVLGASRHRIEHRGEEGDKRAQLVVKIFQQYEKFFGTILLIGNLFNIMVATVGTTLAISTIGGGEATLLSTVAATAIATVVVVVVGELTPKTLAVVAPEKWSLITARVVLILMTVSWPVVFAFTLVPRGIMRLLGGKEAFTSPIVTAGELRTLIDLGEAEGTVEENTGEMLENIFRFGEMEVRDVMTPRPEIVWLRADTTYADFMKTYQVSPHTRFPIYDTNHDDVVGIFSVKDVLATLSEGKLAPQLSIINLLRQANFVPETKRLDDLFDEMQESGHKVSMVVDEFGGIAGLITLSRLVEQIVGRTGEEGNKPDRRFVTVNENTFVLDGGLEIGEANDELGLDIPEGDYETIAGFFLEQAQQLPNPGTRVRFGNLRLQVGDMDGSKISTIRVRRVTEVAEVVQ